MHSIRSRSSILGAANCPRTVGALLAIAVPLVSLSQESPTIPLTPAYINALSEELRTNHPALQAAHAQADAARAEVAGIRTWEGPMLKVGGMFAEKMMRSNDYTLVLQEEIHLLTVRVDAARREALLYQDQIVPRSERTLESAQAAWTANRGLFLEVLDARRILLDARLMHARALSEQYVQLSDLVLCCGLGDLEALSMLDAAPRDSDRITLEGFASLARIITRMRSVRSVP